MAPADKPKKTKKKKEEAAAEAPAAEPAPAAAPAPEPKRASSKRAKRSGSQVFSDKMLAHFKEVFEFIDNDKDGIIGKNDLRMTYDALGTIMDDGDLSDMLSEAPSSLNLTAFLQLFSSRMGGAGADDDDVVGQAVKTFDNNGKIDGESFRHSLITFGEKFTASEVDDAFDQMDTDNAGRIDTLKLIAMMTGGPAEEEEEEEE